MYTLIPFIIGGVIERDNVAKELKFYITVVDESNRCKKDNKLSEDNNKDHDGYAKDLDIDLSDLQRVFIHQSSLNFQNHHFRESNIMTFLNISFTSSQSF
jgi:hypothetical protein